MFRLSPHGVIAIEPLAEARDNIEAAEAFSASARWVGLTEAAVARLSSDLVRTTEIISISEFRQQQFHEM
jgi:hypothetical protein